MFLLQIPLLVPLGTFIPEAGGARGVASAVDAGVLFAVLAVLCLLAGRGNSAEFRRPSRVFVTGTAVCAVVLAASAALPAGLRMLTWGLLAVAYLAWLAVMLGWAFPERSVTLSVTDALTERFGLFIIMLGETVTGVVDGLAHEHTSALTLAVGLIAVVVGFGAWWTYFDFTGHRLPKATRASTVLWMLVHLPLTAAPMAAMGAGHGRFRRACPREGRATQRPDTGCPLRCQGAPASLSPRRLAGQSWTNRASPRNSGRSQRSATASGTPCAGAAHSRPPDVRLAALHDGGRSQLDCRGDPQRRDPNHRRLRTATPTAHPARHGQQQPDGRPIRVRHARRAARLPGPVVGSVCEPVGQAVTRQGDGVEPSGRRRGTLRHRGLPLDGYVTRSERQQIRRTEGAAPCRNTGPRTTTCRSPWSTSSPTRH
ncbi:low temperature requirement protein A [Streptomyces sp. NPDC055966]|uniref:low temperature requirement protein A n=1 Tax=Streptomyces sp. NPDC055966 TaxID=3345669 RepID=UPI0035D71191